ncbi:MAG: proline dehydrogenase family protein [Desulfotalea sp.]
MINKLISNVLPYLPQSLVWMFSKEYVAGKTIEEAVVFAKELNGKGIMTTIDILGEFITTMAEAEASRDEYLDVIEKAEAAGVNGNYSVKPTSFGLMIDKEACYKLIREVVERAAKYDNFVRIDMEDSPCTDMSIDLLRRIKKEFPKNVGLVFQSYLKRTHTDIQNLADLHSPEDPLNFRICKGIYVEPAEIAFKDYDEVNRHFLEDVEYMLKNKMYPSIATHDKVLVDGALKLIEKYNAPKDSYEFQMLYGVTPALRKSIVDAGHRMRVYVPFGEHWFGYCTRRVKENPKMAGVIIKAIFMKG